METMSKTNLKTDPKEAALSDPVESSVLNCKVTSLGLPRSFLPPADKTGSNDADCF